MTASRSFRRSDCDKERDPLLLSWNGASLLTVLLPFVIFGAYLFVRRFALHNENGGDDANGSGLWGNGRKGGSMLSLSYFWSLLSFIGITIFGSYTLEEVTSRDTMGQRNFRYVAWNGVDDAEYTARNLGMLTGATLLFGSFSFLFFLMTVWVLLHVGGKGRFWEGFQRPLVIIPLTFLFWTAFSAAFTAMFIKYDNPNKVATKNIQMRENFFDENQEKVEKAEKSKKATVDNNTVFPSDDEKSRGEDTLERKKKREFLSRLFKKHNKTQESA